MALTIACATCRKQLVLPESLLDQMVSCPSCHTAFSVADQSGKLSIRLPGQEFLPAVPRPAEEIPTVLPAPGRTPFVPLSTGPRPFVFSVKVTDDPEKLLVGSLQARISNAGLELRDKNDYVYPIPVGNQAEYLGGNVLRVSLSGRSITLRITQRACQQSRLAEDIVLFLGQKRTVPRLKDYRPRLAPRLAAWLPLLAAICVLPFGIGGWIGALTWLGLGTVLSFISWRMMRNEARPLPRRFVRLSVAWCVGIVILGPLVPGVLYVRREYFPPPIAWRAYVSSDGLWHARMPGQPTVQKKPLFDDAGKPNQPIPASWEVAFVQLPPYRAAFEVWRSDMSVEEFDATTTEAHFNKIRDDFLQTHPHMQKSSDWESPLDGFHPSRQYLFGNVGGNGGGAKLRVVLARPRIYIMKVSWSGSFRKELEVDRFFSSFILSRLGVLQNFEIKKGGPGDFKGQQPLPPEQRGPPPWTPGQPHWRLQLQTPIGMKGLIGYWPLNEQKGSFTADTSGGARTGQVRGGWWIDGVDGKALMLDGPVDTITACQGRAITFQPRSGLTVACWVATRQADGVVLAMTDTFNTNIKVHLAVKNGLVNGKVWCAHGQPPIDFQASGQARIDDGVWHHIVLIRHDDGSIEIHQDGASQGRKWPGVNFDPATLRTELLTVGSEGSVFGPGMPPPKSFQFCIDELCVFDRAITPFQIRALAGKQ